MSSGDDEMKTKFVQADDAIFRERIVWKGAFGIGVAGVFEGVAGLTMLAAAAMTGPPSVAVPGAILAVAGAFMALVGVLAGVLRIAVTPSALRVQFMTTGLEIPFERIRSIQAERYDWTAYGGWGYRISLSGKRAMSVTGVGDRGLSIVYADEHGKEHTLFVSSKDPEAVLRAIDHARSSARAQLGARVRVDENADTAASAPSAAEESDDADEGSANGDARARARRP